MGMLDTISLLPEGACVTLVISPNRYKLAARLALSFAKATGSSDEKTALIDLSSNDELQKFCDPDQARVSSNFRIRAFNGQLDIAAIDGIGVQLDINSLNAAVKEMMVDYKHLFVLCPGPNKGLATSRLMARFCDSSVVVVKSTNVDRENLEFVNSVISKSSVERPILAIF
jgi:hypothetical protein